jgi:hypothetical protein
MSPARALLILLLILALAGRAEARALAVAWNDPVSRRGALAAMAVEAPFAFVTGALETGRDVVLHARGARLYAVSRTDATLTVVDQRRWQVVRTYTLPVGREPADVAVIGDTAWVAAAHAGRLLRLDLRTGETTDGVDLGVLAERDEHLTLGRIAVHRHRLFVQVQRFDDQGPLSPLMAVVDLRRTALIDVDPARAGVQAIGLAGTAPRMRMQVMQRELFVSATGTFHDEGGLEAIDLGRLVSNGLVVREADGHVGELGAFVLTAPRRGFLTFSTDLLLSSHLTAFDLHGHVGPELHVALEYFVPALAHDRGGVVFLPDGNAGRTGVRAFDDETGEQRTAAVIPTPGPPTDLLVIGRTPRPRGGLAGGARAD